MNKSEWLEIISYRFGISISRSDRHGLNCFSDIKRLCPGYKVDTFFDVGANIGQSIGEMKPYFYPDNIHCFEPVESAYRQLQSNLGKSKSNCVINNVAVGHKKQTVKFSQSAGASPLARIVEESDASNNSEADSSNFSQMITLDWYSEENNVSNISFLKIDTEGHDLRVLEGAKRLFKSKSIDWFQVEVGMNADNDTHEHINHFLKFASDYNFLLFGVYDQVHEWKRKLPHLRRSNLVFCSNDIGKGNYRAD